MTADQITARNESLRNRISARAREFAEAKTETITWSPWRILYFSSCFSGEWQSSAGRTGVFVKVPKTDWTRQSVWPESAADIALATEEHRSLTYLAEEWDGEAERVRWVRPLAFIPEFNAIVTRTAPGADFFWTFRKQDLVGRVLRREPNFTHQSLGRIAQALAKFHRRARDREDWPSETFSATPLIQKIERIVEGLRLQSVPADCLAPLVAELQHWRDFSCEAEVTTTLKGLDIRNILLDRRGDISLLDPGRMRKDFAQADVARLIATSRILYWGSLWLYFGFRPSASYDAALIHGYGAAKGSVAVLRLYVIKELMRQWRDAHASLRLKRWPEKFKAHLATAYIDKFFMRELSVEADALRLERSAASN